MVAFITIIVLLAILFFILWIFWDSKIEPFLYKINFYRSLNEVLKSMIFKLTIILVAGFSAYITFCLGNESASNSLKKGLGETGKFFLENGGLFVFLTIVIPSLYGMLSSYITSKCVDNTLQENFEKLSKEYDITLKVLEQLEKVVIAKRQLLAFAAKDYLSMM
ncbi:hypothetical protein [Acinetobacter venetianus]|uniref:hypothetical protein n=1 Tax=Acinetobacter venetianus TaxID=52133 RepID=UPI00241C48B6|nr:hypothetical protein [Acinetobacter venetianus]